MKNLSVEIMKDAMRRNIEKLWKEKTLRLIDSVYPQAVTRARIRLIYFSVLNERKNQYQ